MAILNGILKHLNGSAGQLTFKTVNGRTIVSEKVTTVRNVRSPRQLRQRTKWGNLVRMYAGIAPLLKYGFEKKAPSVSDYNMFMRVNNAVSPVYLTKTEADGGGCIAAPYQLTQGSLPSIVVTGKGAASVTDIALGDLQISDETTVAEFSQAVVIGNPDFDFGDQLSFYEIRQQVNAETGIPYCQFAASSVVLDKESQVKLWDMASPMGFASVDGHLGHADDEGDSVFAWVHSVKERGKTKVSTQFLIDNNSLLADYTTEEAYQAAAQSYGGSNEAFLTPDSSRVGSASGGGSGNSSGGSGNDSGTDTDGSGNENLVRFTVTALSADESMGTVSGTKTVNAGESVTLTASAASGYEFSQWNDGDRSNPRTVVASADVTYTASFVSSASGGDGEDPDAPPFS
ncbi:MAG: hypothetical protein MR873_09255 [Parabacteroides sp.]|nr:hypothetical protein [Parabacteroides sp.]